LLGIACAFAVLAGSGCGDVRQEPAATPLERAAALEVVGQMRSLDQLTYQPTDRDSLVDSMRFDAVAALLAPNRAPLIWDAVPTAAEMPDCITATPTTATFSGCEIDGHWVDGTISRVGPNVNAEIVDVFILSAGGQGATSIDGALSLAPRYIDGTLGYHATWRQDGRDIVLDATVIFDGVNVDEVGCPIGGTLTVVGSLSSPARQSERVFSFGPECGDVSVGR
jgi:hypothetical protein